MLDKILSFLGLIRISEIEDYLIKDSFKKSEGFDRDKYEQMVELLRKNTIFAQFLDWTINEDIKRAFNVSDIERPLVRGAVSRTRYLRSLCISENNAHEKLKKKISRYEK